MDAGKGPAAGRLHGPERASRASTACSEVDQTPIGKTAQLPRHLHRLWDTIRKLFAETLEARRLRGRAFSSTPAKAAAPAAKARACAPSR